MYTLVIKFIFPFLYSFIISILAIFFLLQVKFLRLNLRNRFGGAVVISVFILLTLLNKDLIITKPIAGILIGGLLILFLGFWDDLKNLSWKWQIVFQVVVAFFAISFGAKSDYVVNPFGGIINLQNSFLFYFLFVVYYLLFINSLNWLDGIDGLAGSVTIVTLVVIFFLSLLPHVSQPALAILCSVAGGAILGFVIFNWHPAKILAGTSGSWFFGFLLAGLSIFAGAKIATVLMAVLIPVLDLGNVIWERYRSGRSIFSGGDDRHLHHKLLKLGMRVRRIVILICFVSLTIGLAALNLSAIGKLLFIIIFSIGYFVFINILKNLLIPNKNLNIQ